MSLMFPNRSVWIEALVLAFLRVSVCLRKFCDHKQATAVRLVGQGLDRISVGHWREGHVVETGEDEKEHDASLACRLVSFFGTSPDSTLAVSSLRRSTVGGCVSRVRSVSS